MELSKKITWFWIIIGISFLFVLFPIFALAQIETPTETTIQTTTPETISNAETIPSNLTSLAQDLGCATKTECSEKFEENFEQGMILAEKHNVYNAEQKTLATVFQKEVLAKLSATTNQDNFEEELVILAREILNKKPALAKQIGFTKQQVEATETIIQTVKDAGVNMQTCKQSPETLSREQLIACVKAGNDLSGKEKSVEQYISKEKIARAGEVGQMFELDQALANGEFPELGNINIEEAGEICLRPESKTISDCDKIAEKFFGAEGVNELQKSREQTTKVKEYYLKGMEKMELVTPDGKKIIGKGAIKNACDMAFEQKNLGVARACGNFAIKNGFTTEQDVENGLQLLESFSQKAKKVNFDKCRFDPNSCKEFLPDNMRPKFDSEFQVFKIMSEAIGFDPSRCEKSFDQEIGQRCMEGAKKALPLIREMAQNSPELQGLISDIEMRVNEGERMTQKIKEFNQGPTSMSGPGGCTNPEACYNYCSQPTNSAECIAFGAKQQIFDQQSVVEKFNQVNKMMVENFRPNFQQQGQPFGQPVQPYQPNQPQQTYQPFQQGEQQNFQQPNQQQGQYPSFPPSYPYQNQYPQPPMMGQVGPSSECMEAIRNGDFVKAKIACSATTQNYQRPIAEPYYPVCSTAVPSPCPDGQIRQQSTDAKNCPTYGACIPIDNYKPPIQQSCPIGQYWNGTACISNLKTVCPAMPSVESCPKGQEKYLSYSSKECGAYYSCRTITTVVKECPVNQYWSGTSCVTSDIISNCPTGQYWYTPQGGGAGYCQSNTTNTNCGTGMYWDSGTQSCRTTCPSGQYWNGTACTNSNTTNSCPTGQYWNGTACVNSTNNTYNTYNNQCDLTTQYWKMSNNTCPPRTNCYDTTNSDYNTMECQGVRSMVTPVGCGTYVSQTSCTAVAGCGWANGACGGTPTGGNYNSCPTGQYWNGTACTNSNTTNSCPTGQYWNGTSCVSSGSTGSCPTGQYWYTPQGGGSGYCMSNTTSGNCPTGYHFHSDSGGYCINDQENYSGTCYNSTGTATMTCPQTNYSNSCPTGQYWYTPQGGGTGYCQSSTTNTNCGTGMYWNGSSCVATSPSDTTNYNTDPSTACAQAGGSWNASTNYCQMPTNNGGGGTECGAGMYWNGTACVATSAIILCSQAGGSWTGTACNLAKNESIQKSYYSYFLKKNNMVAQVIEAFSNLFR